MEDSLLELGRAFFAYPDASAYVLQMWGDAEDGLGCGDPFGSTWGAGHGDGIFGVGTGNGMSAPRSHVSLLSTPDGRGEGYFP